MILKFYFKEFFLILLESSVKHFDMVEKKTKLFVEICCQKISKSQNFEINVFEAKKFKILHAFQNIEDKSSILPLLSGGGGLHVLN